MAFLSELTTVVEDEGILKIVYDKYLGMHDN